MGFIVVIRFQHPARKCNEHRVAGLQTTKASDPRSGLSLYKIMRRDAEPYTGYKILRNSLHFSSAFNTGGSAWLAFSLKSTGGLTTLTWTRESVCFPSCATVST